MRKESILLIATIFLCSGCETFRHGSNGTTDLAKSIVCGFTDCTSKEIEEQVKHKMDATKLTVTRLVPQGANFINTERFYRYSGTRSKKLVDVLQIMPQILPEDMIRLMQTSRSQPELESAWALSTSNKLASESLCRLSFLEHKILNESMVSIWGIGDITNFAVLQPHGATKSLLAIKISLWDSQTHLIGTLILLYDRPFAIIEGEDEQPSRLFLMDENNIVSSSFVIGDQILFNGSVDEITSAFGGNLIDISGDLEEAISTYPTPTPETDLCKAMIINFIANLLPFGRPFIKGFFLCS